MALLEVCCGNLESVDAAVLGGARRIELCADLALDGLTPPVAWLRAVKERYPDLTVHALIRSRPGDFFYTPDEIDTMVKQAEEALEAGADAIVVGGLTPRRDVDIPALERFVKLVENWNLARELMVSDLCHAADDNHFFPDPARRRKDHHPSRRWRDAGECSPHPRPNRLHGGPCIGNGYLRGKEGNRCRDCFKFDFLPAIRLLR